MAARRDGRASAPNDTKVSSIRSSDRSLELLGHRRDLRRPRLLSIFGVPFDENQPAHRFRRRDHPDIYVRRLPGPGGAVRVSAAGGTSPLWRSDGKALFYVAPNGQIVEVDVRLGEELVLSAPRVAVPTIPGYEQLWAVTPNGDRFLRFASDAFGGFTLMLGWPSRLEPDGAEK